MRLPAASPRWTVRLLHRWQRHRHGRVLEPTLLWSHRPRAMWRFLRLFAALRHRSSPLAPQLRGVVAVRVSQLTGCSFCIDMNGALLAQDGASDAKLLAVARWRDEPTFSAAERVALEYAEALTVTPPLVPEDLFTRLRQHFTPEAVVELTALAAFQNMSARFNTALQAQAHGFCTLPLAATAAPTPAPPAATG